MTDREAYIACVLSDVKSFDVEEVTLLIDIAVAVADEIDTNGNIEKLERDLRATQTESKAETAIYCCRKLAQLYKSA